MIALASVVWNERENLPLFFEGLHPLIATRTITELVVVVQASTDDTVHQVETFTALMRAQYPAFEGNILDRPHTGFCEVDRQLSIDACHAPWVLVLDADEWINPSTPLRDLVAQADRQQIAAISLPTFNHVVDLPGQPRMQHFGEERHFRLFKKERVRWPTNVHATPIVDGPILDAPANCFVHHRWRLWAQPDKIVRQVEFTRQHEGDEAAQRLKEWLEGNYTAFRRELGVS